MYDVLVYFRVWSAYQVVYSNDSEAQSQSYDCSRYKSANHSLDLVLTFDVERRDR